MKRFTPYYPLLKPVAGRFILGIVAGIVAGGASAFGLPLLLEKIFPIIFKGEPEKAAKSKAEIQEVLDWVGLSVPEGNHFILFACLLLPSVFIIRGVAGFINTYYITYCGMRVLETIRVSTYDKLQKLSLNFHHKSSEGDLLSRVLTDTGVLQNVLVKVGGIIIVQPFMLLFAMGYLVKASLEDDSNFFMLIALLSIPIFIIPLRLIGRRLTKRAKAFQVQREIRAYNMQDKQVSDFKQGTSLLIKFRMKVVKYQYVVSPMVEVVAAFGVALAIYYGVERGMTLSSFVPLVSALYFAYEPIKRLGKVHGQLKVGEASLDRIEMILHSEDEIKDVKNPSPFENIKGEVNFRNVNFSYEDEQVLNELNVDIKAGETVALVGPSGAGKSSFVSLIPRFYEATKGDLRIDGISVSTVSKKSLRQQIGVVSQNPLLFSGSIYDNILIGKPSASESEVIAAARNANADEFISAMPDGYQTHLSERGEGLSGGQRQRVAIARAFLRDAPILILDEATSALDTESESLIQQKLEELSEGRTTFLIAHRFSSIRHAKRILVFDKGSIVGDGSHEQLIDSCSVYKDLYTGQS